MHYLVTFPREKYLSSHYYYYYFFIIYVLIILNYIDKAKSIQKTLFQTEPMTSRQLIQ